ncbi:C40 family peptidase [Niallia sp. NCCP-28]|uniref:C40 family peptidase n=1 Tax=Niallia sp. NCCP-28 TaxID=2934712 RepID=UPI00208AB480|nr:C40 family peptidase [Niallia sp. NCCP-28]GKU82767.1 putative peptidoglycan endopeptidase LytE [Niallia sp. NCCP-28]
MKKQLLTIATATGILFTAFQSNASAHEKNYKVKSGDSLWKISQTNNLTVDKLKEYNGLTTDTIKVGQNLSLLPVHTHYTVQSGDSLSKIAKAKNTTVAKLKEINGLKSDLIKVGQSLMIPSTKTSSSTGSSTSSTSSNTAKVNAVVAEAKKYIGVPYAWGGSTPSGFDCSGYVNYVFNKVGISIPRTVATIWNATKTVSAPKVGDFVFYETGTGPSHLGIYIGNNEFIHAGSSTGVTITSMSNSYWSSRYLGAKTAF